MISDHNHKHTKIRNKGKEILSMNIIMKYLLDSYTPVVDEMDLIRYLEMNQMDWLNNITEPLKGTCQIKIYLFG